MHLYMEVVHKNNDVKLIVHCPNCQLDKLWCICQLNVRYFLNLCFFTLYVFLWCYAHHYFRLPPFIH